MIDVYVICDGFGFVLFAFILLEESLFSSCSDFCFRFGLHVLGVYCIDDTPASISSFYYEVLEWSCSTLVGGCALYSWRFVCVFYYCNLYICLMSRSAMVGGDLIR